MSWDLGEHDGRKEARENVKSPFLDTKEETRGRARAPVLLWFRGQTKADSIVVGFILTS